MQQDGERYCPGCGAGRDEAHADWCEYKECPWCSREHLQGQCATDRSRRRSGTASPSETKSAEKASPSKILVTNSTLILPLLRENPSRRGGLSSARHGRDVRAAKRHGTERADVFASPEQSVDAWLSHMRGKFADVEYITRLGWRGWGLVFRCTDARGGIRLYSVMVGGHRL